MTGIAGRIALEIVLVLRFRLPEFPGRSDFGHDLAGPQAGRIDLGDGLLGDAFLVFVDVENRRAITRTAIVALTVRRAGVVNLEKKFQDLAVAELGRIEQDLDRLGVVAVIAIGGVAYLAAGLTDARRDDALVATQEILHAPETSARQDRARLTHARSST
jgi:hypothetical protein